MHIQHSYSCCLFYRWRTLFTVVANASIVLPCLQVSATVRRFFPGWVGLKKKCRNDLATLVWMSILTVLKTLLITFQIYNFLSNMQTLSLTQLSILQITIVWNTFSHSTENILTVCISAYFRHTGKPLNHFYSYCLKRGTIESIYKIKRFQNF